MRIHDLMRPQVITIAPEASMAEAFSLMSRHDLHHLVVTEGSQVLGVLAASDVASLDRRELPLLPVRDCMSRHVVTVSPDTSLKHAAELMQRHHFECLPVCQGGELVGIVTIDDLLAVFCRDIEHMDQGAPDWCALKDRPVRWRIHPLD